MSTVLYPSGRIDTTALGDYPDRIDVRSPSEFAEDHLPGAVNHPVLDDDERKRVGTMFVGSPFAARKLGAALVARNIASMLDDAFADKPREWRPLIYCWRGGQRSRSLTHVLNEIGWRAMQLDGGYRSYRRHVVSRLEVAPLRLRFFVLCGLTGSGKSQLLRALAHANGQTLDLEAIAQHRGSLLGELPDAVQPSQKWFETQLCARLDAFDPARPVFVESESRRIGAMQLPESLLAAIRSGQRIVVETPLDQRVALLREEYRHFVAEPASLTQRLAPLVALHGKQTLARWNGFAENADWDTLIRELLELHYDPSYRRSLKQHFSMPQPLKSLQVRDISPTGFDALAREVIAALNNDFVTVLEH